MVIVKTVGIYEIAKAEKRMGKEIPWGYSYI